MSTKQNLSFLTVLANAFFILPGQSCVGYDYGYHAPATASHEMGTDAWFSAGATSSSSEAAEGDVGGLLAAEAAALPDAVARRMLEGGAALITELTGRPPSWIQRGRGVGVSAASVQGGAGVGAGAWAHGKLGRGAGAGAGAGPVLGTAGPLATGAEVAAAERGAGMNNPYISVFDVSVSAAPARIFSLTLSWPCCTDITAMPWQLK